MDRYGDFPISEAPSADAANIPARWSQKPWTDLLWPSFFLGGLFDSNQNHGYWFWVHTSVNYSLTESEDIAVAAGPDEAKRYPHINLICVFQEDKSDLPLWHGTWPSRAPLPLFCIIDAECFSPIGSEDRLPLDCEDGVWIWPRSPDPRATHLAGSAFRI